MGRLDKLLARLSSAPPRADERADLDRCARARDILLSRSDLAGDIFESLGGSTQVVVGEEVASASMPDPKARLAYRLVRLLEPRKVVELGSAFGVSGSYIASALAAADRGSLVTIEGAPSRQRIAAATIESVSPGRTRSVLGMFDDHLHELDGADIVFIDGNHRPEPTLEYVAAARERGARPLVLVLDDVMGWSDDFTEMWRSLERDGGFDLTGEAAGVGVLVVGDSPQLARHARRGRFTLFRSRA